MMFHKMFLSRPNPFLKFKIKDDATVKNKKKKKKKKKKTVLANWTPNTVAFPLLFTKDNFSTSCLLYWTFHS